MSYSNAIQKRDSVSRRVSTASSCVVSCTGVKYERHKKSYYVNFLYPILKEKDHSLESSNNDSKSNSNDSEHRSSKTDAISYHSMLDDVEFAGEGLSKDILMHLITHMLIKVGAKNYFNLTYSQIYSFVECVATNYNDPAFHKFEHAFCVTQMAYTILHKTELVKKLSEKDKTILLVACLCHDINHQGFTNPYHIRNCTYLAEMYNNTCPMENHHAAVTSQILKMPKGVLQNLSEEQAKVFRDTVTAIILATDMEKHNLILQKAAELESSDSNFNLSLLQVIMKAADLSNELRSPTVAYTWIHRMYEELNTQMKHEGLPYLPTDPVFIAKDQIQFLNTKILPIYKQLNAMTNDGAHFFLQRIQKSIRRHQTILDNAEKPSIDTSDSTPTNASKTNESVSPSTPKIKRAF